jgi:hypothetical protein
MAMKKPERDELREKVEKAPSQEWVRGEIVQIALNLLDALDAAEARIAGLEQDCAAAYDEGFSDGLKHVDEP